MAQFQADNGWIYQCDDIVVEPRAHRLERAGVALSVEPKAYAVLVALLQQAGEVVSKNDLLDAAWGHRHVTPGVLTRAISQLRHSLGDCADSPRYIATVHCLGYRFIGEVTRVATPTASVIESTGNHDANTLEVPAAAGKPPTRVAPPVQWLAAVITLVVIVAMLAAASLRHPAGDHLPSRHMLPRPALVMMPVAHNPGSHPHRWPHGHRIATDYGQSPQLRAAGYLIMRPEQASAARG